MNRSNFRVPLLFIAATLIVTSPARAAVLANNFWVNPTFESGSDLNQTTGTPANWNRGGGDPTICQVITNNSVSSSHSLAVIDTTIDYGEWYSDVALSGNAVAGNSLNIQWYEMYSIPTDVMRLTVLFLDATNGVIGGEIHFTTPFTSSPGWVSTIADSTFVQRNGSLTVPVGAVTLRIALVSGGDAATTGTMVIDDLSVAVDPNVVVLPPTVLVGNFNQNPTFELGVNLNDPALASPGGGWIRGGNFPAADVVITNNSVSPTHSLALIDDSFGYGEWYKFIDLAGVGVGAGDVLDEQLFRIYSVTNGAMRFTMRFLDSFGFDLEQGLSQFFAGDEVSGGQSPGWTGSIATSPFERVTGRVLVPADAKTLRFNFASGGSGSVMGLLIVDDVSVRLSPPVITSITAKGGTNVITWLSMPSKLYTVQFATNLNSPTVWMPLATNLPGDILTVIVPNVSTNIAYANMYTNAAGGGAGFYRVLQQP